MLPSGLILITKTPYLIRVVESYLDGSLIVAVDAHMWVHCVNLISSSRIPMGPSYTTESFMTVENHLA